MCDSGCAGHGERRHANPPSLMSKAPTRSTHTLVRDNCRSSRRNSPPSISFPLPSGQGGESRTHNGLPYIGPPFAYALSRSAAIYFRHRLIRTIPPVPSPCGKRCQGGRYGRCDFAITLLYCVTHSCRWRLPIRGEVGWESQIGALTSRVPGTDVLTGTHRTRFIRQMPI
jgi:hypothetical protein